MKILWLFILLLGMCNTSMAGQWRQTGSFEDRNALISRLNSLVSSGADVDGFAQRPDGNWLLVSGQNVWASDGFPTWYYNHVNNYVEAGNRVKGADCNAAGACIVVYQNWAWHQLGYGIPSSAKDRINHFKSKGWSIRDLEVTNSGYVILGKGTRYFAAGLPSGLNKALKDTHKANRTIRDLSIGFENEWALFAGHNPMFRGISASLANRLNAISYSDGRLRELMLARDGNYFVYTRETEGGINSKTISAIEWGLGESGNTNIWKRMDELNVPGVSVAVIEPNGNAAKVKHARGYGLKKSDEYDKHILSDTPFPLASLSKYLSALTTLRYAYSNNVPLDQNIFELVDAGQIHTWRTIGNHNVWNDLYDIPDNNLNQNITLSTLLSHTANFPSVGESRIPKTYWNDAENLSTLNWLLGWHCYNKSGCQQRSNSAIWQFFDPDVDPLLEGEFLYSNPGYMVLQATMEDLSGLDAADLINTYLFQNLDLTSANAWINKSNSYLNKSAWMHGDDPAPDWFSHRNIFASNIYTSSGDYAKAMIIALNEGRDQNDDFFLPSATVDSMLTQQGIASSVGNYGFGVNLDDNAVEGSFQDFDHGGSFNNRVRTKMCGNPSTNEGLVILTNSGASGAQTLINEIIQAYLDKVNWPDGMNC